jgi:hypothetical protein
MASQARHDGPRLIVVANECRNLDDRIVIANEMKQSVFRMMEEETIRNG